MSDIKIKCLTTGDVLSWSMDQVLCEINRDRSDDWTPYDETDWQEGWFEWVSGEFYVLHHDTPSYHSVRTLTADRIEAVLDEVFSNIFGDCYG
tara:strand:+ start:509 stop:787 length:279 start_codon:yes stop_codon:yes gene_type:complete